MQGQDNDDALAGLISTLQPVLADLADLASAAQDTLAVPAGERESGLLAALRPRIKGVLQHADDLVAGAGLALAPGALSDRERHLEWWWRGPARPPEALRVNLDSSAPDFYDYVATDWYQIPWRTSRVHVSGPYVDYACSNTYALTIAHPMLHAGEFLGVAAADLPVAALEVRVLPRLLGAWPGCALVNPDGRVVLSTVAAVVPGRYTAPAPGSPIQPRPGIAAARPPAPFAGWRVIDASRAF